MNMGSCQTIGHSDLITQDGAWPTSHPLPILGLALWETEGNTILLSIFITQMTSYSSSLFFFLMQLLSGLF